MRYAIIGYGKMGRIRHQAMQQVGAGHAAKIYDQNPDVVKELGPLLANSIDDIIEDPSIEAVIICTPNFLNKPLTLAALRAGKHVFCEKPPAFNAEEMREIIKVEEKAKRVLMYGFNHRHHGGSRKLFELVESNEFGALLWIRGRYGKSVDSDFFNTWRAKKELAGGGILLDQGIHMLDLFLSLAGNFDEVHALVSNLYWNLPDIEDNVFAIMRNSKTGVCASLHSTMTQWRHLFSLEVFLERGYMVLNGLKTPSGTYGAEVLSVAKNRTKAPAATWSDEKRFCYEADESWQVEMRNFLGAINSGRKYREENSLSALKVMELIDRIYSHARHKRRRLYNSL